MYKRQKVFARDVSSLIPHSDLSETRRLFDLTKLMTTNYNDIQALFYALGGLLGSSDSFLYIEAFAADATLYEEALSMVRAKGFAFLSLEDTVSVLNRRRD